MFINCLNKRNILQKFKKQHSILIFGMSRLNLPKKENCMTALEKKQMIIQKIQDMPDELIDDITNLIQYVQEQQQLSRKERFEKLLNETNEKYKKVWVALA